MPITRRLLLLGSSCLAMLAGLPRLAFAERARITVILTNDIYLMNDTRGPDGRMRGGFPRLAAVVKAERAKGGNVLFAHAGDTLSPSLLSGIDHGYHIVSLTNMIAPDIFVPGNHEFDFGKETFIRRMGEARFPLFAANMRNADGAPMPGFKDRTIMEIGGVRIGLTGAALTETPEVANSGDVKFAPLVATVEQQAALLRKEGADFVVAIVHAPRHQDLQLFNGHVCDLILTGHDHDLFLDFDGRTAIAESSHDGHFVTMIDLTIDVDTSEGRRTLSWFAKFRIVDTADVEPDPDVLAAVRGFEAELSKEFDVAIARTDVQLDSRTATVRTGEAAIGDLFADAIRFTTGAQIAIINGGGLRGEKVYPPGSEITRRDVFAELPFGNHVAVLDVSGKVVREAIENGISLLPRFAGRFPQVSGMSFEADLSRPPGHRVLSIRVGDAPLDETKMYRLATNDFMARGGDGYTMFRDARQIVTAADGPLMANEVMVYLRKLGTVRTGTDGRIVLKR
ncbi:MAG: bifunctional metallophosphatase/5'-nucleotidase [Pseudorhodoplanes sp.]|nr:bifunctional metallophosphatase/5'-nucleotidase [Pseudorhodoplanes sp.]